jgi:hypothetical protein
VGLSPDRVKPKTIKLVFVVSLQRTLKGKSKDWFDRNQDDVSEWGDLSTSRLLLSKSN